ncbi:growth-regulating factor 1-like isoform X1 [Actinidia eriantha]|uniref:growth-regulating factor 1-like isoform X1 n=1 Tax=Actinidia eriantha TaxID=165200 RepID=UPI002585BFD6|nr:growth-regulating factor 1-like isoform X1 [Actinidia eriantha]
MMDLGGMGPENGVSYEILPSPEATKPKSNIGSGFWKQVRSGSGEEDLRGSKVPKTEDFDAPKTMLYQRSNSLISDDGLQNQNMLCFSSPRSEAHSHSKNGGLAERSSQNLALSYFQHTPYAYSANAGYGCGGMHGPFTPSQWVELEHQALIYKYVVANVPVPANLLIALKRSLNPYGLYGFSGSYAPSSLGSASFHLGFSGNTDPEPGRCRRTDGKKWRCSRDAVADQKYCERHINRGRHRSRKPVECRTGQAISGPATKVAPVACSTSASVMSGCGASNRLGITHQQFKGLQPAAENPSADVLLNRMPNPQGQSVVSPTTNLKAKDSPFSIPKQHMPIDKPPHLEFGLVSSDSLFSPSQNSPFMSSRNNTSILDFNDHESQDQHLLHHFIDDWSKDQSNCATIAWPDELKSDWTQLSMSIPMASSDFSSTSSSSRQEKLALSPLRLAHELDPLQDLSESTPKNTSWIPLSWGSSIGGPLGEVLNSTPNTVGPCKVSSAFNLANGVWIDSPHSEFTPTGVLQKTTFVSLSNSSSGSSPRADKNKTDESGSLGDDMLGSTLASSFSIPSL